VDLEVFYLGHVKKSLYNTIQYNMYVYAQFPSRGTDNRQMPFLTAATVTDLEDTGEPYMYVLVREFNADTIDCNCLIPCLAFSELE